MKRLRLAVTVSLLALVLFSRSARADPPAASDPRVLGKATVARAAVVMVGGALAFAVRANAAQAAPPALAAPVPEPVDLNAIATIWHTPTVVEQRMRPPFALPVVVARF